MATRATGIQVVGRGRRMGRWGKGVTGDYPLGLAATAPGSLRIQVFSSCGEGLLFEEVVEVLGLFAVEDFIGVRSTLCANKALANDRIRSDDSRQSC